MNLNKLFPTEQEKEMAKNCLIALKENPDWKFVVEKIIKFDIQEISDIILNDYSDDVERIKDLKRRRAYWIILSELPETLLEILKGNENKEEIKFDPYYTAENINERSTLNKRKQIPF